MTAGAGKERKASDVPTAAPARRLVVLGASNCARGLVPLVEVAQRQLGEPLEIMGAIGHGRSYRHETLVVVRRLPGILSCGLWQELAERPALPGTALVTDIGNDLLYGATPEMIADWVEETLTRLSVHCQQTVVTLLPLERVRQIGAWQFRFFRSLFFPLCQLSLAEALYRAEILNELVAQVAQQRGARLIAPPRSWYGLDPIHIRRSQYALAWQTLLGTVESSFGTDLETAPVPAPATSRQVNFWQGWRLAWSLPQERKLLGRVQRTAQPSTSWSNGSTLSLF